MQAQAREDHRATARRQAIEAIGEVGGIALGHKDKQTQRPDQQPKGQHPAQGKGHIARFRGPHPAAGACPDQKQQGCSSLEGQFPLWGEARIGLFGEAAPIVHGANGHVGEGDRRHRQQPRIGGGDQATDQHPHRHHQEAPHGGGAGLALMGFGPFLADHLAQL